MRFILYLCVLIFVSGCVQNSPNSDYKPSPDEKLADNLMYRVAAQLQREKNLHPCGFGGRMMNEIRMLTLCFDYYKEIEIEEGRELVLFAANVFLKTINDDEQIRPYLKNYPFLPKNIGIVIFLRKPNGSTLDPEKIHVVDMSEGILRYKVDTPRCILYDIILTETFEQATEQLTAAEKHKAIVNL